MPFGPRTVAVRTKTAGSQQDIWNPVPILSAELNGHSFMVLPRLSIHGLPRDGVLWILRDLGQAQVNANPTKLYTHLLVALWILVPAFIKQLLKVIDVDSLLAHGQSLELSL